MCDLQVWETVSGRTGSLLTGLSVLGGVVYFVFDCHRERRAQAGSILVWLYPHEHGPPEMKMLNLSGRPVFDHGVRHHLQAQATDSKAGMRGLETQQDVQMA